MKILVKDTEPEKKATRPESREERRQRETINKEAVGIQKTLMERFTDFFVTCENPEGPEVTEKMQQISAQWRTHCKRRNLIPSAYPVMDDYMKKIVKVYQDQKTGRLKSPQEKPEIIENPLS